MEPRITISWLALIAIHVTPAAVLFAPSLVAQLYGVSPNAAAGVLIVHRGSMFLAIVAVAALAIIRPDSRRAASLVVAISMLGYLIVYARAGFPAGALRTEALVDAVGVIPLAFATWHGWRGSRM